MYLSQWTPDRSDLIRSGYWPKSVNADTLFSVDVFSTFEEMKTVAPGLSRQGFLRLLEQRTQQFGRVRSVWMKIALIRDHWLFHFTFLLPICTFTEGVKYMEMYFRGALWNKLSASFYVRKWQMCGTLPAQHLHSTCLWFLQMAIENWIDFDTKG